MSVKTRAELEAAADLIRTETGEAANTPARVGGFLRDAVDSMPLASEVSGGAPTDASYLVGASNGSLSAERVITDTATIVWDIATASVVRANVPDGALTRAKLANAAGISVLGRSADSAGVLSDIPAPVNDRIFARVSNVLGFFQVTGTMIQTGEIGTTHLGDDIVTNAKAANMAAATIKGRALGAGTGDPTDLTPAQVRAIIGSTIVTSTAASTTWEKDPATVWVDFVYVGGGGGGGAVGGGVGGGGGGPGAIMMIGMPEGDVPDELTLTVGAAGAAGANGGDTQLFDGINFGLVARGGLAGVGGGSGGAGGTAGTSGINSGVAGGNGHASAGLNGSFNPFGGTAGSGATGGPGTGGSGYGAGGGGGAGGTDGGGGGAGGYSGTATTAGNGGATNGGAGAGGYIAIIERLG